MHLQLPSGCHLTQCTPDIHVCMTGKTNKKKLSLNIQYIKQLYSEEQPEITVITASSNPLFLCIQVLFTYLLITLKTAYLTLYFYP